MKNANKFTFLSILVVLIVLILLASPSIASADDEIHPGSESLDVEVVTLDPIWCPVRAQPGDPSCSSFSNTPQDLIDDMVLNTPFYERDGIIYFSESVTEDFKLTDEISNLGSAFDALRQYNLTLQGGWNGGFGNDFLLDGQSDFGSNRIQIGQDTNPWIGNISLGDLMIQGAGDTGLIVYTEGDILIDNLDSRENAGRGALLINNFTSGDVTVRNSRFEANSAAGLRGFSDGEISLTNVKANSNYRNGVVFIGLGSVVVASSTFDENGGVGLEAGVTGTVTMTDIIANSNGDVGVQTCRFDDETQRCLGSATVTITGTTNVFNDNGSNGLLLVAQGDIQLSNVAAIGNKEIGALLVNCLHDENGACLTQADVIVSNSVFSDTYQRLGLDIMTDGDIHLTNITAENNGGHDVENPEYAGAGFSACNWFEPPDAIPDHVYCQNTADSVTIDGSSNVFRNNSAVGFEIYASGVISLTNVTSDNNQWGGAYLDTLSGATVAQSTFSNNLSLDPYHWNRDAGLVVNSLTGHVTLNNSQMDGNGGYGIHILTDGNATLSKIASTGNSYDGLLMDGFSSTWADKITINGGVFADNGDYGLEVYACQLQMNGRQTLGGNTSGTVLFGQNPTCAGRGVH